MEHRWPCIPFGQIPGSALPSVAFAGVTWRFFFVNLTGYYSLIGASSGAAGDTTSGGRMRSALPLRRASATLAMHTVEDVADGLPRNAHALGSVSLIHAFEVGRAHRLLVHGELDLVEVASGCRPACSSWPPARN